MVNLESTLLYLPVSDHHAYLWDVNDIAKLRTEYRICGILGGTSPHMAQQNIFLGVPLILMPEEVVLLVEKGMGVIVEDAHAHLSPSLDQLEDWNECRMAEETRSLSIKEESKTSLAISKSMSKEALRKRREREERRASPSAEAANANEISESSSGIARIDTKLASSNSDTNTSASRSIIIPTSSSCLSWYKPTYNTYNSLDKAREARVWDYPSCPAERARCDVFRALWEKGYYMGSGIKFGGDFLVYPGDPLRYHSHFVASVLPSSSTLLRPMEIVAHGRLGTATKKAHLLCSWDADSRIVDIYSIEWAGFG